MPRKSPKVPKSIDPKLSADNFSGDRKSHHYVVGIGASAGGLEALTSLVSHLAPGLGMAYVVVQHLSPSYKSMLPQLLSRETELPVMEIVHGQPPLPDTIYITPPNRNVLLKGGKLELMESPREVVPKPSANLLFSSLADECKDDAIGIVLSGTGSDGSNGIRAIKAAGGFTFAQDPLSARYDGMPRSAIETGCVDWIQTPEKIAEELARLSHDRPVLPIEDPKEDLPLSALKRLLAKVRVRTKLDFSGYKETTLWRRVERRLFANRMPTLDAYLAFVDQHPEELDRLAKDVLISVTAFLRDRESFSTLETVLNDIVGRKNKGDEIRIWVPGCATGEEAYSIAILLHQVLGNDFDQYRIQLFATDVDTDAMQFARRGIYSAASLAELDPQIVQRYFRPIEDRYEISRTIRDVVLFARQDLVLDPPFLRLDLISCRNVLIYLQPSLQARILSLFHYALLPEGRLFLGKSESVAQQDLLFVPEHKEERVFRRRADSISNLPSTGGLQIPASGELPTPSSLSRGATREHAIIKAAARIYVPPAVIVNGALQIQHVLGNASEYLQIPVGRVSLDLSALLMKELKLEAQALIRAAGQKGQGVEGRIRMPLKTKEGSLIRLAVHPLGLDGPEQLFLVAFESAPLKEAGNGTAKNGDACKSQMEDELTATREHLQTLVEELETTNEEMQALNEEVQAANEELQATNEELEASNEELQSTNEELLTINEELQIKSTDLVRTNADLESIQNNVGMPMLVTDHQGKITRFNGSAAALFKMHPGMIGEPLSALALPRGMDSFEGTVTAALDRRKPTETHLGGDGRDYLLRISLNYCGDEHPIGAIISLLDQSELVRANRLLQESEARLRAVMDHTPFLVAIKNLAGAYLYANTNYEEYFAADGVSLLGVFDAKFLPDHIVKKFREEEVMVLRRDELVENLELIETRKGQRYLEFSRFPLRDSSGEAYSICIQAVDVTEKRRAEEQLRLAARVIGGAAEAVVVTDANQTIVTVNEAFCRITGYSPEEMIGKSPRILKSGKHDDAFYRSMWADLERTGVWQGEIENRRKDGSVYAEWLTINAIRDNDGVLTHYVAIFSDITTLKETRQRLEHRALHDELTGLPNRALFNDRANLAVIRAKRNGERFAIMFIDLDNFKDINDSLGHEVGDILLKAVAERLKSLLRQQDTVSRLGGDEFVILTEELRDGEAEVLAERCRGAMSLPFPLQGNDLYVSASMGIALYPDDGDDVGALLQSADSAMYRAKQSGRNTYTFSTVETRRTPAERLNLINGLRQAMQSEDELHIVFQPQFNLPDHRVIGLEALIRWNSPSLGAVPPARFIPLAEETGLILPLTDWIFRTTLAQIRAWKDAGLQPPPVSLNVSPFHLRGHILSETLTRTLDAYDLSAESVTVEVTEGVMGQSPEAVTAALLQLKGLGVKSSLDDFGTGFSSLSRLSRLPVTTLKIDRSFVDGLDASEKSHDLEIARTIILMAHSLEMTALAEGVETEGQLKVLSALGCDAVQGFFLSHPLPATGVEVFLRRAQ